jgi:hypothetical protein
MEEPVIADDETLADLFGDFKGIDFGEAEATAEDYGIEDEESKAAFSLGVPLYKACLPSEVPCPVSTAFAIAIAIAHLHGRGARDIKFQTLESF